MDGFELTQPRFKAYILPNAPLQKLADGFRWTATATSCCSPIFPTIG